MFYTVYKITNTANGKIYIGVHKTDNLDDDYMGSGKLLKAAQEKYGIENFTREYLQIFDNAEDMFKMESELVNEEFIARNDTYNLTLGGNGGWDHCNTGDGLRARLASENVQKHIQKWQVAGTEAFSKLFNEDEDFRKAHCDHLKSIGWTGLEFLGKKHSEETKAKMSERAKLRTGDKNSQFGTMWIMNPESGESKKIKKDDLIPDGWVKGRKIKNVSNTK